MTPPEDEELEPPEELDEEELELDDELEEELELEELLLELDEDELDDELDDVELDEELEDDEPLPDGAEHSLTPPATLLPAPKVASEQTKLPLSTL